jgi:hypothetical protein
MEVRLDHFALGKRRVDVDVEDLKRWWKKKEGGGP